MALGKKIYMSTCRFLPGTRANINPTGLELTLAQGHVIRPLYHAALSALPCRVVGESGAMVDYSSDAT